jgi:sulfotransferase family protein
VRLSKTPVFIVGNPRSGTSILVRALFSVGYRGYNEGNFLPLMGVLNKAIDHHISVYGKPNPNVLAAQIDADVLKSRIADVFKEMTDNLNVGPLWVDKSGNAEMIRSIPTLRRLWPNSVYIFAKRRAIENVVSRVKKFPAHNFEYHCADWAKTMAAWRKVREKLPSDVYLEIDQQDLIRYTEATSWKLLAFLELNPEKLGTLVNMFTSKRPQETAEGSALKTYSLDSLGWSEHEMAIFKKHCASEMEAFGYGSGSDYNIKF